jgi:hypothetical protein
LVYRFADLYSQLKAKPYFRFINFAADDVVEFDQDAAVAEMHDRIIAGLARRIGASLITIDPQLKAANGVLVVW